MHSKHCETGGGREARSWTPTFAMQNCLVCQISIEIPNTEITLPVVDTVVPSQNAFGSTFFQHKTYFFAE